MGKTTDPSSVLSQLLSLGDQERGRLIELIASARREEIDTAKLESALENNNLTKEEVSHILYADDHNRSSFMEKMTDEQPERLPPHPEITRRGTKRVRRVYRTREEIGGDPQAEANRRDSMISGRVTNELKEAWEACVERVYGPRSKSRALTEAIQDFIDKHEPSDP